MLDNQVGTYIIIPDNQLILEYYSGNISMDDLIYFKEIISKESNYNFSYNTIIDFRDAIIEFDKNELNRILDFFRKRFKVEGTRKVAYLTSKPNEVVATTLFSHLTQKYDEMQFKPATFSTIDAVARWFDFDDIPKDDLYNLFEGLKSKLNNVYKK